VRTAVVGHTEWIEFARVEHVPAAGEIVHALESWQEPAGGGAVAAVQMARLTGETSFFTALGDDDLGHRAHDELTALGLDVKVAWRHEPQRRGFVFVDAGGERTITVIGERMGPVASDALPWADLADVDAVYFTAGDADAVRLARAAGTLVATARGLEPLAKEAVELDTLVASGKDAGERYERGGLQPEPRLVVRTAGAGGGEWERADGETGRYSATPLPGEVADAYGCGDSFAAGLTVGLGSGKPVGEALELAARCGAAVLTGRGPYSAQLTAADV
jgi:ribokinase